LQHQDGHSHLTATTVPSLLAYDPAFAYEVAVIVQDGLRRMYEAQEECFYYMTLYNENYVMPAMPDGAAEGILRGMYRFRSVQARAGSARVQLLGSGPILQEVLRAQAMLAERYGISSDVWSVTSYKQLRREAMAAARWNMLHPTQPPRVSYLQQVLEGVEGPFVAASDYVRLVAEQIAPWLPDRPVVLGTDGFGRSDSRTALRRFFEVDAESIAVAALHALSARGAIDRKTIEQAIQELGVDPDKPDPSVA
jgi:pyruvate dehydrogenase E1 component